MTWYQTSDQRHLPCRTGRAGTTHVFSRFPRSGIRARAADEPHLPVVPLKRRGRFRPFSRIASRARRRSLRCCGPSTANCVPAARRALGVVQPAHFACRQYHTRSSRNARLLVHAEGCVEIAAGAFKRRGQRRRILDRHAGALRQVLQHRVRGVAQQRQPVLGPGLDRVAVGGGLLLPAKATSAGALCSCLATRCACRWHARSTAAWCLVRSPSA